MNQLSIGKLGYKNLSEYMAMVYGDQVFESNNVADAIATNETPDDIDGENQKGENERHNNELGLNNEEIGNMAYVGDDDDNMEEQDYGYMQVIN